MKSLRLKTWRSGSILSPRTRPSHKQYQCQYRRFLAQITNNRHYTTASIAIAQNDDIPTPESELQSPQTSPFLEQRRGGPPILRRLRSPPPVLVSKSSRLAALHARLSLPPRLPLESFARCLVDSSADPTPQLNNASLCVLGNDLLGYFTSEAILCRYPRLPTEILFAAMAAYVGSKTMAAIVREWGVEAAAYPGPEVDPGLLQFQRKPAGNASVENTGTQFKEIRGDEEALSATRPNPEKMLKGWRRGVSSRAMYDDEFGEIIAKASPDTKGAPNLVTRDAVTQEAASTSFARALVGALYLHSGMRQTKAFYNAHIMSRHLDVSSLFKFQQPTRDLSKLCAREGFEPPVARMLSETGRKSRHPVFLVGIFSGREKLGEGSGGSLDEARIRAAVAALKGWYLYSPLKVRVPSETVGKAATDWEPALIDGGEVIV